MKYLATEKEAKEIDQISMEEFGIPSAVLMERAACKICRETQRYIMGKHGASGKPCLSKNTLKEWKGINILSVCGTGNNGGDAAAAARMLSEKGYNVKVLISGNPEHFSEMMKLQADILHKMGLIAGYLLNSTAEIDNISDGTEGIILKKESAWQWIQEADIIIDGIFGIGLSRPVQGLNKELIEEINKSGAEVISVDVPSGIHAGTGMVMEAAVKADITVTFGVMKKGLVFYPGHLYAGKVVLRDCGFPKRALESVNIKSHIMEKEDLREIPGRRAHSNKGSYGRVLVIAGSRNMSGAAWFSAMAAYRTGVGLVKIFTEIHNETALKTLIPEALFSFYQDDGSSQDMGSSHKPDENQLYKELKWADSVVIGPGISKSQFADWLLRNTLGYVRKMGEERYCPVVLDADGINLAAAWTKEEKKSLVLENQYLVMTPHIKEMAVFLGEEIRQVQENTYRAQELLQDYKGTLVLKDDRTVICHNGESFVNTRGCNGMATGGSGDVLTGIIAGILAQRKESSPEGIFKDAALGVLYHALSGEWAAELKGNSGMTARDILEGISRTAMEACTDGKLGRV